MKHVSEERLVAYRDGEDDPKVREHLASCEKCQRKFDDSRWSLSLQRMLEPRTEARHPSPEELTAFWDNALSPEAEGRIQRHIRTCNRCLAVYRRMRGIGPERAYRSPRPDLVRAVRHRFSSRPSPIDLGRLWLRWVGGAPALVREPERPWSLMACEDVSLAELDAALPATLHPSSARARRQRLSETRRPKSAFSEPVHLEAGNLHVELQVHHEDDETRLRVKLDWADGKPARDVPLLIVSELGGEQARTNEQGRAELKLPEGPAKLEILTRTPVRLRLNADKAPPDPDSAG